MTTPVESPAIRRACEWIAGEGNADCPGKSVELVMEAARRFDLSPLEAEFLLRLVRRARDAGEEKKSGPI